MCKLFTCLCEQSKQVILFKRPADFFFRSVILWGVSAPCMHAHCVLFIVFERLFLEVNVDLDEDFSVAFARHLGSPWFKLRFILVSVQSLA